MLPLAWLYGAFQRGRTFAYDAGLLPSEGVDVPVICVGNLTAGGTGKTPLVEYIVRHLQTRGRRVAVISRGYGRKTRGCRVAADGHRVLLSAREGGDEPVQIARHVPGAIVVVAERRLEAAQTAVRECNADVIVMDDGFQHRSLKRNLDIVVVDARKDLRTIPLLPAGLRREPLHGLSRAGLIALSRSEDRNAGSWLNDLPEARSRPVIRYATETLQVPRGVPLVVFSGIGDHAAFVDSIRKAGGIVAAEKRLPDHHWYTARDLEEIAAMHHGTVGSQLVTSEKDVARLEGMGERGEHFLHEHAVAGLPAGVVIIDGEETLHRSIAQALS